MKTIMLASVIVGAFIVGSTLIALDGTTKTEAPKVTKAKAVLKPTFGNYVKGIVTFEKEGSGIKIVADIEGLKPGKHGFHIHEKGDCSAADASSAGGHFNPLGTLHGSPDATVRHVGDLGNIEADQSGRAHYERFDKVIAFEGKNSILDRAIIVHEKEDDFVTQPTGNAGARVACGVILPESQ